MKRIYLQGVAIAALSYAMMQSVWAGEATPPAEDNADNGGLRAALAQATPDPPASAPLQVAQGATTPTGTPSEEETESVIVTAFRRETLLQDTPISLGVINTQDLEKRHVQSLLDLADGAIPSLRIVTYESRQTALTVGIRGIVPGDANQPARDLAFACAVGIKRRIHRVDTHHVLQITGCRASINPPLRHLILPCMDKE